MLLHSEELRPENTCEGGRWLTCLRPRGQTELPSGSTGSPSLSSSLDRTGNTRLRVWNTNGREALNATTSTGWSDINVTHFITYRGSRLPLLVSLQTETHMQPLVVTQTAERVSTEFSCVRVLTQTESSVLHVHLCVGDAGVSVQLTVVPVGFAVTATNPVLRDLTVLQRKRWNKYQMISKQMQNNKRAHLLVDW